MIYFTVWCSAVQYEHFLMKTPQTFPAQMFETAKISKHFTFYNVNHHPLKAIGVYDLARSQ